MLDVLHEQERHATTKSGTTLLGGAGDEGAKADAMEAARGGAMVRWMTEEDLSNQNILQCKAHSAADVTQGETARTHAHLFGLILSFASNSPSECMSVFIGNFH